MLIDISRHRANHIREYARTHITTVDKLAKRYSLSPHTIRAYLCGVRCVTPKTKNINLRNNRIYHRAIIIKTLRACGVKYKDISRFLNMLSKDQITRALKIEIPQDFNIIPTISIFLNKNIKDIDGSLIRSGKYVVRAVDNQYDELILNNGKTSYIVNSINLIGVGEINEEKR